MVGRERPRGSSRRRRSRRATVAARGDGRRGRERPRAAGAPRRVARRPGGRDRRASRPSPATARASSPRSITGLRPLQRRDPRRRRGREPTGRRATRSRRGVAHVPEDRTGVGSAPNLSVYRQPDHEALPGARRCARLADRRRPARGPWPRSSRRSTAIAAPSVDTQVRLLSGGNLQRLILAREIETDAGAAGRRPADPRPRRRGDRDGPPAAPRAARRRAPAILLISEDLDEILALADRVDVMYEGRIVGSFDAATADVHEIGLLMTGGGADEDAAAAADEGRRASTSGRRPGRTRASPTGTRRA